MRFDTVCTTCIVSIIGSTLITVGEYQRRLGGAEREFLHTSATTFLTPLRNFLEGDWRTISVSLTDCFCLTHCYKSWCFKTVCSYYHYPDDQKCVFMYTYRLCAVFYLNFLTLSWLPHCVSWIKSKCCKVCPLQ